MSINYLNTSIYNNPIISRAIAPLHNLQAQKTSSNLNNSLFDQNINTSNQALTNPSISLDTLIRLIQLLQKMMNNPKATQTDSQNTAKNVDSQMTTIKAAQILRDNMPLFEQAAGSDKGRQYVGRNDLEKIAKNNSSKYEQQRKAAQYILNNKDAYNDLELGSSTGKLNGNIYSNDLDGYIQQQKSSNNNTPTHNTKTTVKNDKITNTKPVTSTKPVTPTTPTTPVTPSTGTTPTGTGKSLYRMDLNQNVFDTADWQKSLNIFGGWNQSSTKVTKDPTGRYNNVLRATYQAGLTSEKAPGFWTKANQPTDHAFLKYSVRPGENFDFVNGGKFPGLYGGAANSGGHVSDGTDGWSTRTLFRKGGAGGAYAYLPPVDGQKGVSGTGGKTYGQDMGAGSFKFTPGKWTDVEQEVKLNTPGKNDGVMRLWADGKLVYENTNVTYRTTDKLKIDGMILSTMIGGKGVKNAPKETTFADFANFQLSDKFIP